MDMVDGGGDYGGGRGAAGIGAALVGASVVHHIPGRVRIKLADGSAEPEVVRSALDRVPGLLDVDPRPASRSVVVTYEPTRKDAVNAFLDNLPLAKTSTVAAGATRILPASTVQRFKIATSLKPVRPGARAEVRPDTEIDKATNEIEEEAEYLAEHSHTARILVDLIKELDTRLKLVSHNYIDLKILVPGALVAVMVLKIGVEASTPMWVTLAMFTINHFVELRAHQIADENEQDDIAAGALAA